MTVQYVYIAHAVWEKNIADLKGDTDRKKQICMLGGIVIIPKELTKLHKYVFMTADIFLVNPAQFLFCWVAILALARWDIFLTENLLLYLNLLRRYTCIIWKVVFELQT